MIPWINLPSSLSRWNNKSTLHTRLTWYSCFSHFRQRLYRDDDDSDVEREATSSFTKCALLAAATDRRSRRTNYRFLHIRIFYGEVLIVLSLIDCIEVSLQNSEDHILDHCYNFQIFKKDQLHWKKWSAQNTLPNFQSIERITSLSVKNISSTLVNRQEKERCTISLSLLFVRFMKWYFFCVDLWALDQIRIWDSCNLIG